MTIDAPSGSWRRGLFQSVENLERWFRDRVAIAPDPSDELLSARSLFDRDALHAVITRTLPAPAISQQSGADEIPVQPGSAEDLALRVAASRFARHYSTSLTAAALAGLTNGIGLDLSAERCTLLIRHDLPWVLVLDMPDDTVLGCTERPAPWPVSGPTVDTVEELRQHVWRKLYAENLWPVLEATAEIGQIGASVLWTNAAESAELVGDSALEYLDPKEAEPFVAETRAVVDAPGLPGLPPGTNPLRDRFDRVPGDGNGFPETVATRKLCCVNYLADSRFGRLCQSCPYLPVEDRIALARERHGVPMGAPGGSAEQRSIERGMARPSTRRLAKKPS